MKAAIGINETKSMISNEAIFSVTFHGFPPAEARAAVKAAGLRWWADSKMWAAPASKLSADAVRELVRALRAAGIEVRPTLSREELERGGLMFKLDDHAKELAVAVLEEAEG